MNRKLWTKIKSSYSYGNTISCVIQDYVKGDTNGPARFVVTIGEFYGILLLKDMGLFPREANQSLINSYLGRKIPVSIKMIYDDKHTFLATYNPIVPEQREDKMIIVGKQKTKQKYPANLAFTRDQIVEGIVKHYHRQKTDENGKRPVTGLDLWIGEHYGFLPIAEICWGEIKAPLNSFLPVQTVIEVAVQGYNPKSNHYLVSLKQVVEGNDVKRIDQYRVGERFTRRVIAATKQSTLLQLDRENVVYCRRKEEKQDNVRVGHLATFSITEVNLDNKRLSGELVECESLR